MTAYAPIVGTWQVSQFWRHYEHVHRSYWPGSASTVRPQATDDVQATVGGQAAADANWWHRINTDELVCTLDDVCARDPRDITTPLNVQGGWYVRWSSGIHELLGMVTAVELNASGNRRRALAYARCAGPHGFDYTGVYRPGPGIRRRTATSRADMDEFDRWCLDTWFSLHSRFGNGTIWRGRSRTREGDQRQADGNDTAIGRIRDEMRATWRTAGHG
ncbi:MAG: hypothetical protein INR71_02980 [Terriglobus roseus]|nr:hypothetical protein [Terriglobus roseus]